MKKKALVYISTACIIVGCTSINTIAQPNVRVVSPYNTNLVISPSNDTKQPMSAFSSISGFDQIFSNLDPSAKNIKRLNITSAKIESSDPSKKNIGMFKSLKMYISMGDGSNEILIASNSGISQNAGSSLALNLNKMVIQDRTLNPGKMDSYTSIEQVLVGVPGVQVSPSGDIRIRGVSTTGSGVPLYVVDGVERSGIQGINPSDVESIEVLKDAVQLSMYGLKGANGVIKIKLKSGNPDSKPNGSLDNFVKGSTIRVRFEYVLRYALKDEAGLNVTINFTSASK